MLSFFLTILPALVVFFYFYFSNFFLEQKKIALQIFVLSFVIALIAGELNGFIQKNFSNNNPIKLSVYFEKVMYLDLIGNIGPDSILIDTSSGYP